MWNPTLRQGRGRKLNAPLKVIALMVAMIALMACTETGSVEPTRSPDQVKSELAAWLLETDIRLAEVDSRRSRSLSLRDTGDWSVAPLDDISWSVTTASGIYTVFSDGTEPILVAEVTPTPIPSPTTAPIATTVPSSPVWPTSGPTVRFNQFEFLFSSVRNCLTEERTVSVSSGTEAIVLDEQPECGRSGILLVQLEDGTTGWASGDAITPIDPQ